MTICVFTGHLGVGDMLTMNGAVRKLLETYDKIIVVCKKLYYNSVLQMYSDNEHIQVYPLEKDNGTTTNMNDNIYKMFNCDYKFVGFHNMKTYNESKEVFFKTFYIQLGFEYEDKLKYEKIVRKHDIEDKCYNKLVSAYGDKYIFMHDHRGFTTHYNPRSLVTIRENKNNLPIFHPNTNAYLNKSYLNSKEYEEYKNTWTEKWGSLILDNIFDYCKIIENATEIHIRDSCFSCLCPFLDLSKVKRKVMYSDIDKATLAQYSKIYENWEFVHQ